MAYLSLYRKYRPQNFADVAGQDHVVQTLQNAVKMGRIAHGYLFCGTRGVAKTTIARIFAKCLNCVGPDGALAGPQPEPCNECVSCRSISAGQCVDVVEMDAASNRSVADIAKLREGVQFGPMENRYKVYIVDEAHQLSSDAKDAFLKTLEEPPANVVFILATTEAHAIPVTIASRCQHFEFKRGSVAQIASRLDDVLAREGVAMEPAAIQLVARAAEGSYRDSLSLLEQVLAYKREEITAHDVAEVLGTVQAETMARIVDAIAANDAAEGFAIAAQAFESGKDVRQFIKALSARFRDMLFVAVGAQAAPEDAGSIEDSDLLREQARRFTPASLLSGLDILAEAEREIRFSNQHRLLLEMALLKLMTLPGGAPAVAANSSSALPASIPMKRMESPTNGAAAKKAPVETPPPAPAPVVATAESDLSEEVADEEEELLDAVPEPAREPQIDELSQVLDTPAAADAGDEIGVLRRKWQEVIHHMQVRSQLGAELIKDATPIAQEGKTFTLAFTQKANRDMMENTKRRSFVEEIINKTLEAPAGTFHVKAVLVSAGSSGNGTQKPGAARKTPAPAPPAPVQESLPEQPEDSSDLLDEVIAVFGGKIIEDET